MPSRVFRASARVAALSGVAAAMLAAAVCSSPVLAFRSPPLSAALTHTARTDAAATDPARAIELPPLPPGVTQIRFDEFFQTPVGPRGLEYTDAIRGLDGKRVRILGYMARRTSMQWGRFLLTPIPVQMHDAEYGLADDLPPATLLVEMPPRMQTVVSHTPGLMLLTGILRLGNFELPDDRTLNVKLELDPPPASQPAARVAADRPSGAESARPSRIQAVAPAGNTPAAARSDSGRE